MRGKVPGQKIIVAYSWRRTWSIDEMKANGWVLPTNRRSKQWSFVLFILFLYLMYFLFYFNFLSLTLNYNRKPEPKLGYG